MAISINKGNLTHDYINNSKVFTINILPISAPLDLVGRFGFKSGRDTNKFEGLEYKAGQNGAPILINHSIGYIEAKVIQSTELTTHTVFYGEVVNGEILSEEEPLTYAYYQKLKRGTAAPVSPVTEVNKAENIQQTSNEGRKKVMQKYECSVCSYVYDPEKGDPDSGIEPGTAFEALPDDWTCPVCGVDKTQFNPVD